MKNVLAACVAFAALVASSAAQAVDCNAVINLLNQGFSMEDVARAGNISLADVDACSRRHPGVGFNPAGPPPVNAAGPPPFNAAGPAPRNPAGAPPFNAAGPPPVNAAGPAPRNPAGIPR
jgi:hypothetical protein